VRLGALVYPRHIAIESDVLLLQCNWTG
jgi:hypothetical protein